jgi:hypothetical protein
MYRPKSRMQAKMKLNEENRRKGSYLEVRKNSE